MTYPDNWTDFAPSASSNAPTIVTSPVYEGNAAIQNSGSLNEYYAGYSVYTPSLTDAPEDARIITAAKPQNPPGSHAHMISQVQDGSEVSAASVEVDTEKSRIVMHSVTDGFIEKGSGSPTASFSYSLSGWEVFRMTMWTSGTTIYGRVEVDDSGTWKKLGKDVSMPESALDGTFGGGVGVAGPGEDEDANYHDSTEVYY